MIEVYRKCCVINMKIVDLLMSWFIYYDNNGWIRWLGFNK